MEEKRQRQEMIKGNSRESRCVGPTNVRKRKGASTQLNKDKLLYVRQQRAQAKAHREKVLKSKAAEEKRAKELKDKIRQREIRLKMKKEAEREREKNRASESIPQAFTVGAQKTRNCR